MLPVIEQRHSVSASRAAVIAGLSDLGVLKAAIPRCREVRRLTPDKVWIATDIGVLRWTFQVEGIVTLRVEGAQVVIASDLRTRTFRLGHAVTTLTLTEDAGRTMIHSTTTLTPARAHSLVMRRTIGAVAKTLLTGFFQNFRPGA